MPFKAFLLFVQCFLEVECLLSSMAFVLHSVMLVECLPEMDCLLFLHSLRCLFLSLSGGGKLHYGLCFGLEKRPLCESEV